MFTDSFVVFSLNKEKPGFYIVPTRNRKAGDMTVIAYISLKLLPNMVNVLGLQAVQLNKFDNFSSICLDYFQLKILLVATQTFIVQFTS